jgi:hypothetical protein
MTVMCLPRKLESGCAGGDCQVNLHDHLTYVSMLAREPCQDVLARLLWCQLADVSCS